MIKSDIKFEDEFIALILLIIDNTYKIKFYLLLLILLYI